jgi:hypothetical protein
VKAPGWLADVVAGLIVLVYVGVCVWLIATGKGNPDDWDRHMKTYGALTPLVGAAVGWVFGREVHRQAAKTASEEADKYRQEALNGRELAATIKSAAAMSVALDSGGAPGAGPPATDSSRSGHLNFLKEEALRLFPPAP